MQKRKKIITVGFYGQQSQNGAYGIQHARQAQIDMVTMITLMERQHLCECFWCSYLHGSNLKSRTTDTSFVDNPPSTVTSKAQTPKKLTTPKPVRTTGAPGRGGASSRGGTARGGLRGTRGSGLARGTRGSGIPSRLPRA